MSTEPVAPPPSPIRWRIFPALAIITVGAFFLANNLGYTLEFLDHGNWWAWFILLAAFAPLTRAYEIYRANGRFDTDVAHHLLSTGAVVLVAVMFLLNLDWGVWWPLFVILGGLYTLMPRRCTRDHAWRRGWHDEDATLKH